MVRFMDRFNRCWQRVRPMSAMTWQPDRENSPLEMLGVWADKWLALETHTSANHRLLDRDFQFYALMGDCVFRMDLFNAALEKKWQTMPGRLDDGNDYQAYARYLAFHNNRIISGVRPCFFDQTPAKINGFPFAGVNEQVLELGQALWKGPSGETQHFRGYPFYLAGYCYLLGLLHGVVVEPFSNTGVFLTFAYDAMHFFRLKGRVRAIFRTVDSEYALRRVIHQIRPVLLTAHLEKAGMAPSPGVELRAGRICQQFVHVSRTTPIALEPLTWHLADILAAVDAHLGESLEYSTLQMQSSGQQPLVDLVCRFTTQCLTLFEQMYAASGDNTDSQARIRFDEWFDLENRFLTQWLDLVDSGKTGCPIEGVAGRLNRKAAAWPGKRIASVDSVPEAVGKPGGQEPVQGVLSVEQVIEILPPRQMTAVFRQYAHLAEIRYDRMPDILIGIGGTGTFLAHLVNYFRQTDIPVSLFQSSLPVGCRPASVRLLSPAITDRTGRAVICTRSVKTLFNFAMLEAHLRRKFSLPDIMEIQPFFLHQAYDVVETWTVPVVRPLFTVENGKSILNPPASPFRPRCPAVPVWPGSDPKMAEVGIAKCLIVDDSSDPVRIDYNRIVIDTRTTVSLALAFAGQIKDSKDQAKGPVYLFSPSPAGRVLALGAGCFLRHMGVDVRFVTSRQAAAEAECHGKTNTFLIDLTRVTGFTADHAWQTLTHRLWDRPVHLDDLMQPLVADLEIQGLA